MTYNGDFHALVNDGFLRSEIHHLGLDQIEELIAEQEALALVADTFPGAKVE